MHPIIVSSLAANHHRDLLVQAERARLVHAARLASKPRTIRRRLKVRPTRLRPVYAFHAWLAAVTDNGNPSIPTA